jgi:hypothetical protein
MSGLWSLVSALWSLLSDLFSLVCDGENSETNSSLDFAKDCGYISDVLHQELVNETLEIGKMPGSMINNPNPFLIKQKK